MARRRRAGAVAGATALLVVLAGGGYVAADAYDVVPGLVTLEPPPPPPAPFPTPPGAVPAPPVEAAVDHLDPAVPVPSAETVTALAAGLAADPRTGGSVGIVVADALTGEVLADVDGDRPRTPASTAKVLTALAAITALGPERTLATRVVQPEPGRVVLVGGGDMMLAAGAGDPDAVNGHAGLVDLAAQTVRALRQAGITEVTVGVDDTLFVGPSLAPGWRPGDVAAGYVAPVAALGVNVAKTREAPYPPRFPDPAAQTAEVFAGLLTQEGISVTGPPERTTAGSGAPEIGRVESAPVGEIAEYAVQLSENTITEVLGRLVAVERGLPASFEGATDAVLLEAANQGIDVTGARLADTSGLADGSALPAGLLTDVLLLATDPDHTELLPVVVDLPVSGWQGTLADRYRDGVARGLVRAKTGSLPGVTSLAGTVLTQEGRLLVFAVLADATPPGGQPAPRAAIDGFVQALAACGCPLP